MNDPPFALFVTGKDLSVDYVNECLTRAWKGNDEAGWGLYLVASDYDRAPKRRGNMASDGTEAPVKSFESSFVGKTPEECAVWLQAAPEDVDLDRDIFATLDEHSKENDTITMCRVLEDRGGEVEYFPVPVGDAVVLLITSQGLKFDERLEGYQSQMREDGKPDLSKGKPYSRSQCED